MTKKLIVLDTETTGLEVDQGHRIVEVGAVALEDRRRTDVHFHSYLKIWRRQPLPHGELAILKILLIINIYIFQFLRY